MNSNKKVILVILDGWGYGKQDYSDAVFQANTPSFDSLVKNNPNASLLTDGLNVGLPEGQMGNSEVGHINIGAGRVVFQDLVKINQSIVNNELEKKPKLIEAFDLAKEEGRKLHFMGLISDGGIHSHQNHLVELCNIAAKHGVKHSYIHAFTDGRDTDPNSGAHFISDLVAKTKNTGAKLASVIGRYYAMDRDQRWERIKLAYDLLRKGKGDAKINIIEAIKEEYSKGITDEFLPPIFQSDAQGNCIAKIEENDVVICFNFRTDRCRQITRALHQEPFPEFDMEPIPLHYLTMTKYDERFKDVKVLFEKDNLNNTLGEVLSRSKKKQIRIAETEKYPHVSFFFSGGREAPFEGEDRIMVPSPKVATYDLQPEMSAEEVTSKIIERIEKEEVNFICLNYANPDMVGHTGDFEAIKKAVEKVDQCLSKLVKSCEEHHYSMLIIADHGNADFAVNEDGSPNTAHSTNPVPVVLIDNDFNSIKSGKLADVAPSILKLMNINIPAEMTGEVLI